MELKFNLFRIKSISTIKELLMINDIQRRSLVILGMHRSGTSALSGVLNILGVDLGRTITGPKEDNPKGFFENTQITTLNDLIMERLGFAWDDPFPFTVDWRKENVLTLYQQRLVKILATEFTDHQLIGFKDPRICLLLPWWRRVLLQYDLMPSYPIIFRHPLEVAASLEKRNHFSIAKSVLLWMKYMLAAERYTRHQPRFFLSFDQLLMQPIESMTRLTTALQISLPFTLDEQKFAIDRFLEKPLKHHNLVSQINASECLPLALDYYGLLQQISEYPGHDSSAILQDIDDLSSQYENLHVWFCPKELHFTGLIAKQLQAENQKVIHFYYAQLFIDTGIGFNEGQSINVPVHGQEHIIEFDLSDYDNVKNLRFDPVNDILIFYLKNIQIINAAGEIISITTYQSNAYNQSDQNLLFNTVDPQIIFTSVEHAVKVIISLEYIAIGAVAYSYILQWKDVQLQEQAQRLATKETELSQYVQSLFSKNAEIQQYVQTIQSMENTLSWKLIKNLKKIRNYFYIKHLPSFHYNLFKGFSFIIKRQQFGKLSLDHVSLAPNHLTISGWAISLKIKETIKQIDVSVDDRIIGSVEYGHARQDVGIAYPKIHRSDRSGFSFSIALTGFIYNQREYEICLTAITTGNKRFEEKRIVRMMPRYYFHCDGIELSVDTLNMHGWVLSDDEVIRVEVCLDGKLIESTEYGHARPDVGAIYPDMTGSDQSGFSLSAALVGFFYDRLEHEVCLTAVTMENRKFEEIRIVRMTPRYHFHCDEIELSTEALNIRGWILSDDEITRVEVHLDGKLIGSVEYGHARPDVGITYSNISGSDKSGFSLSAVLTGFIYDQSEHVILFTVCSQENKNFEEIRIARMTPRYYFHCDEIELVADALNIRGWMLSDDEITRVEVFLDDQLLGNADYGLPRIDVGEAHPNIINCERSGFKFHAYLELVSVDREKYPVRITVATQNNYKFDTFIMVKITPRTFIYCDQIKLSMGGLGVVGWIVSDNDVERVDIYFDGILLGSATYGIVRLDVGNIYPNIYNSQNSGFRFYSDLKDLTKIEASKHTICITVIDKEGQIITHESAAELENTIDRNIINIATIKLNAFLETPHFFLFPEFENPILTIVLILFNRAELTFQCLESIKSYADVAYQLIILNNASNDKTSIFLEKLQHVTIIKNSENIGFLKACNQAVDYAKGTYLLFLNNDTQILPETFSILINTIESDPSIGVVGGKLIFPDGNLQEAGSIIWQDGSCSGYGRGDNPFKPEYSYVREVPYCSGALLLTRRTLFNEVGKFDERYAPAYFEEVDYCLNVREKGYKIIYQPFAQIIHHEFASSQRVEEAIHLQEVNKKKFVKKWSYVLSKYSIHQEKNIVFARTNTVNPSPQRILFIDDRIPDPALGSGYPRCFDLLNAIVNIGYQVTFFPLQNTEKSEHITFTLQKNGVEVIYDHSTLGIKLQLQLFLQSRSDYYDFILISRPHNMKEFLDSKNIISPRTRIIYDGEAVFAAREVLYKKLIGEEICEQEQIKIFQQEMDLAKHAHAIITVSKSEKELFEKHGLQNIHVVGHQHEIFLTSRPFEQRQGILFVGGILGSPSPNEDAVLYFVEQIYPYIYQNIGAKYYIVGTNISARVKQLQTDNIIVTGRVENLVDYYNACRIFVVPTRYAAGIPYKLHEASAYGLPSVATNLIAKQLGWQAEEALLIGINAQDFAEKCVRLYTNQTLWETIRKGAIKKVEEECNLAVFQENLRKALF
ncbi:O-antigen biosynthesis protein [Gammaproteobacteria bacterium]